MFSYYLETFASIIFVKDSGGIFCFLVVGEDGYTHLNLNLLEPCKNLIRTLNIDIMDVKKIDDDFVKVSILTLFKIISPAVFFH